MGSEASRTGYGTDAVSFRSGGLGEPERSEWHGLERRVLLGKLRALEERAKRLEYVEGRLRDLHREVQRLRRLADATHTLHTAESSHQLLDTALGKAVELLRAANGSICLCEHGCDELVVARARGACSGALEGSRIRAGQGVVGYVALHREPVVVGDIVRDGRFARRESARYATGSSTSRCSRPDTPATTASPRPCAR